MNNTFVDLTPQQFQDFSALPVKGKFQMLNLLKFKEKVGETGTSGAEAYVGYMRAISPLFQQSNAKVVYYGELIFNAIGPENDLEWDRILIVEYANKHDFLKMITSDGFPKHLRSQSLEDSRLILCTSK